MKFNNALCDLEASINLIHFSCYRKLGLEEVKPTSISLQIVDYTIQKTMGILEVVLVKADKFYFLMDFIILDMDENDDVLLIFSRHFLATSHALIDI